MASRLLTPKTIRRDHYPLVMLGLALIRRLRLALVRPGDAPNDVAPEEVVSYEGRIHINGDDGGGFVQLVGKGDFIDYLYEQLEIPDEDGLRSEASIYARITVEVFPDPDMAGWPNNPQPPR